MRNSFQTSTQRYRRGCVEHESGNTQRAGSLWSSWSSQVAVRRVVGRRYPCQQHGGRRNTRVRTASVVDHYFFSVVNSQLIILRYQKLSYFPI